MTVKVVTAPTVEPVTLEEAKAHLRVDLDFTDDDVYIDGLISAARDMAEGIQSRALAEQTLELIMDRFECRFRLARPPISNIESVKYRDASGEELTIPPEAYIVNTDDRLLMPSYGLSWPSTRLYPSGAVRIRYTAGYTPETIPKRTKQAILLLIGHWYENREAVVIGKTPTELPMAVKSLLSLDKVW